MLPTGRQDGGRGKPGAGPLVKFSCDSCRTTYTIPEERVLGRVIKIRCSRCRSVVEVFGPAAVHPPGPPAPELRAREVTATTKVVRGEGAAEAARRLGPSLSDLVIERQPPDGLRAELRRAPGDGQACWFAVVRGRALGPLSREELLILAKRGQIGARSYVWRPGMLSWERIERGKDLAFLREEVRARMRARAHPRPLSGMENGIFVMTGLFDRSALDDAVRRTPPPLPRAKPRTSPFDGVEVFDRVEPEHSAWYVLDVEAQQALCERDTGPDVPGTTPLVTGRHLIRRRRPWLLAASIAAIAALFLAGVLLVAWLTRDSLDIAARVAAPVTAVSEGIYRPSQEVIAKVRALLDPGRGEGVRWPGPKAEPPTPATAEVRAELPGLHVVGEVTGAGSSGSAAAAGASDTMQMAPLALQANWASSLEAPARFELGSSAPVQGPQLTAPSALTADDVARLIETRRPQLEVCYDAALKRDPDLSGSLDLSVLVNTDGRVRRVLVRGARSEHRQLARCLEQRMQRWTFPPPPAEVEVVLPVRLRPTL